jgi:hypothetical protein
MEKVPQFLLHISDSVILMVVMLIGILVPLIKFRSLGRAALFAAVGFEMLALGILIDIGHGVWAVFLYDYAASRDIWETVYWIKTGIKVLISIIGFVLLILAIVVKRPTQDVEQHG